MRWPIRIYPVVIFLLLCSCSSPSSPFSTSAIAVTNRGSDTMVNLALAWAEAYSAGHPTVAVSVSGGGSGTGIASLINGTVDIANASRAMTREEIEEAKRNGVDPKQFIVSRDAIAVIVNPKNPVNHLTLAEISDIFSGKINNWSEVGGENRPIVRLSREVNSGTHVYFLEAVIRLGQKDDHTIFAADTLLLPSSEGITSEISQNPNAIGYDGLGYVTSDVKVIGLSVDPAGPFVLPGKDTVIDHTYPVSRDLYMYTNGEPTGALKDYLDWILGPEAQQIVVNLGFIPIA